MNELIERLGWVLVHSLWQFERCGGIHRRLGTACMSWRWE